jgi:hypothetical protein
VYDRCVLIYINIGYYSTTNQIKEKATPLQYSLALVNSLESLQVIEKLCYNVIVSPKEAKYRRVKLQNAKIDAALVKVPHALEAMELLGWKKQVCVAACRFWFNDSVEI